MAHREITPPDPTAPTPVTQPVNQGTPDDSISGRILPRGLRVLDRLGSTPEGALYQAEYPNGVEVVLLVVRSQDVRAEPSRRERFRRATQIQHPNVAAVYEVGETEDGSVYVVLEQLVGEPLSNLLTEDRVFALGEALELVLQVAAGLRAAYREGFVHGNLSPQTILVTRDSFGRPQVKLSGFTLDSAFGQQGAGPQISNAAAGYASPERLAGQPPDERSEVFSLGAVLHHLLTGVPPEPSRVDSSVPKVARSVFRTTLAPDPDRRFQTISELDEALMRLAAVVATPKRGVIGRVGVIGAVAAGVALVTGGGLLLLGERGVATREEPAVTIADSMHMDGGEPGYPTIREAPAASVQARSPARAPPPARRAAAPRTQNAPADSDRSPAGVSAGPAPAATRPRSAGSALADAEPDRSGQTGRVATPAPEESAPLRRPSALAEDPARMRQPIQEMVRKPSPELPLASERKGRKPDDRASPRLRPADASTPAGVEKRDNRREDEGPPEPEALGYVGEPVPPSVPDPPPDSTVAPEARQARVTPPIRTTADPRPRAELERDQGLRQSIADVIRVGVAEEVAEVRPGFLVVSLTPGAMRAPSALYNLQRLYLAYSAATEFRDEVALELRHGRDLYGWFTRQGLTQARPQ